MPRPNLFEMATGELSQDGFLSWLLEWADKSNENENPELFRCGQDFVRLLVQRQIDYALPLSAVKTWRQWKRIDIWAEINDDVSIIIEDKTFSSEQGKQLERYRQIAGEWCKDHKRQLVCIYLKTGSESTLRRKAAEAQGYDYVNRTDMIAFLDQHRHIRNDIFSDYLKRLKGMDDREEAFEKTPPSGWESDCWIGLYRFLQTKILDTDWAYVPNKSDGFYGFWWHFRNWSGTDVYLQIEEGNLCFKIGEVDDKHSELRKSFHDIIVAHAGKADRAEIIRPRRFGNGTSMTVAIVKRSDWLARDDELINMNLVVQRLKEYEAFLDQALQTQLPED